jgi:hypothetical protein
MTQYFNHNSRPAGEFPVIPQARYRRDVQCDFITHTAFQLSHVQVIQ